MDSYANDIESESAPDTLTSDFHFDMIPAGGDREGRHDDRAHQLERLGVSHGVHAAKALVRLVDAQPLVQVLHAALPTPESMPPMVMADETKSSSCSKSFWLPRSVQPPSARIRTHSRQAVQPS